MMDPTLREDPPLLLRLIRDQLDHRFDPAETDARVATGREEALGRARRLLASRPQADRERFDRVLSRAVQALHGQPDEVPRGLP